MATYNLRTQLGTTDTGGTWEVTTYPVGFSGDLVDICTANCGSDNPTIDTAGAIEGTYVFTYTVGVGTCEDDATFTITILRSEITDSLETIECSFSPLYRHSVTEVEQRVEGIISTTILGSYIDIEAEWFRTPGSTGNCGASAKCPDSVDSGHFTTIAEGTPGQITVGYSNLTDDAAMPQLGLGDTIDVIRLRKSDNTNIDILIDNTSDSFDPGDPNVYATHVSTQINSALATLLYIQYFNFIPFSCIIDGDGNYQIFTTPKKTAAADWIGIDYNHARLDVNEVAYIGDNSGPYVQVGGLGYNVWDPVLDFSDITCPSTPSMTTFGWDDESDTKYKGGEAIYNGGIIVEYNDILFVENVNNTLEPTNYTFTCGVCEGSGFLYSAELLPTGSVVTDFSWELDGDVIGTDQEQVSFGPGSYTVTITSGVYALNCISQPHEEI